MKNFLIALLSVAAALAVVPLSRGSTPTLPPEGWTKLVQDPATKSYANYWHLDYFSADLKKGTAKFVVNGYISKAAYQAGAAPVNSPVPQVYSFSYGSNPPLGGAGITYLTTYARGQAIFSGSVLDSQ